MSGKEVEERWKVRCLGAFVERGLLGNEASGEVPGDAAAAAVAA